MDIGLTTVIESNEDVAYPKDLCALENAFKVLNKSVFTLVMVRELLKDKNLQNSIHNIHYCRANNKSYVFNLLTVRGQAPSNETSISNELTSLYLKSVSLTGGADISLCEHIINTERIHAEQVLNASTLAGSFEVSGILGAMAKAIILSTESLSQALVRASEELAHEN